VSQNSLQSTDIPQLREPSSHHSYQQSTANTHQHGLQPPTQRLGNSHTEHQTEEFINCVRAFNPNFSFQYLLHSISAMLLQFMQHPYESALPIIFNTFLASLLNISLPRNG
jgi:hypothetical protein